MSDYKIYVHPSTAEVCPQHLRTGISVANSLLCPELVKTYEPSISRLNKDKPQQFFRQKTTNIMAESKDHNSVHAMMYYWQNTLSLWQVFLFSGNLRRLNSEP